MSVAIIRLNRGNAAVLDSVAEEVFDEPIRPERVAAYVADPSHITLLAISEGVVVGQARAVVHRHPDKPTELYIDNLGVAPSFWRHGIAARMLNEMIGLGKHRGCEEIWVSTEPENEPARALYRSLGLSERTAVFFEGRLE